MFGANGLLSSVSKFADARGDILIVAKVSGGAVSGEREENARSPIAPIKLQDQTTRSLFVNRSYRQTQNIHTLPNLISDLAEGHYKKYYFFVFNLGINQVYILNNTFWDLHVTR
jgi:hypothetical protein